MRSGRAFVGRIKPRLVVRVGRIRVLAYGGKVKVEGKSGGRVVEVVALLNSGYEAPTPQLLIPVGVARELGFWPPENAFEVTLETAGGR